jgi:hypothetical protein
LRFLPEKEEVFNNKTGCNDNQNVLVAFLNIAFDKKVFKDKNFKSLAKIRNAYTDQTQKRKKILCV